VKEHKVDKKRRAKLKEIDTKLQVVEGVRLNMSIPEIADQVGITVIRARELVDEAYSEMHSRYIENAEKIQAVNIARLEYLYSIAETWASGNGTWIEIDSEGEEQELKQLTPDRMWMKQAVDIIKAEMDVSTKALKHEDSKEKPPTTNIENMTIQQTLIAGGELYEVARQNMDEDWFSDEQAKQWADLEGEDLITINAEMVSDPRIDKLEKSLNELMPEEVIDDDDDGSGL
jgi:predicted RND superfamily exporter protein